MSKNVKKKTFIVSFFSLVVFLSFANFALAACPGYVHSWDGTVRIGGLIAPQGTTVTAHLNGSSTTEATASVDSNGNYIINVAGVVSGSVVSFKVGGVGANEGNQTWESSWQNTCNHHLDLSVSQLADTIAPTRSNGLPTGNITNTSTTLRLTTDESATCKYGTTANTSYSSIANTFSTTGGTSHSQSLTGLSNGTYNYYIRCIDTTGNNNTNDYTITFTVNTSANDTTAPYRSSPQPTNHTILLYNKTTIAVNLTTDENARCRYNTTAGIVFADMSSNNETSLNTSHTWNFTLTTGTKYNLYFKCNDTSGNNNTDDYYLTFSTGALATNTSFNLTANQTSTLDVKDTVNVTLDVVTNTSLNNTSINVTTTTDNTTNTSVSANEFKYVNIDTSDDLNSSVFTSIMIKIYYTDEELVAAGITDENTLAVFWFNETSNTWIRLNATSMDWVYATGVNTTANYIWANVSHLSYFAGVGLKANGVSCTANTDCYSNFCRSDYPAYSSSKYCAQSSSSCVHTTDTLAQQYASSYTTCYGDYTEECSSGIWSQTGCSYGCSNGVCGSAPTTGAGAGTVTAAVGGVTIVQTTKTISSASPTSPAIAIIESAKAKTLKVDKVTLEVKETVSNVQITVKEASLPSGASLAISTDVGKIYKYVSITTNLTNEKIEKVKIKFKVEKTWINNNNISSATIALQRYADDKWNKLPTTKLSEDTTYVYYEAESPGLSTFAITGEKVTGYTFYDIINFIDKYYKGEITFWEVIDAISSYYGG